MHRCCSCGYRSGRPQTTGPYPFSVAGPTKFNDFASPANRFPGRCRRPETPRYGRSGNNRRPTLRHVGPVVLLLKYFSKSPRFLPLQVPISAPPLIHIAAQKSPLSLQSSDSERRRGAADRSRPDPLPVRASQWCEFESGGRPTPTNLRHDRPEPGTGFRPRGTTLAVRNPPERGRCSRRS